jgi:predicted ATPase/DNA-binding SARP family transcriptional activator
LQKEKANPGTCAVSVRLRAHLFGVPSFEWDGATVSVSARPLCAVLLAMILLAGPDRRLSRKAMATELWPDDDEMTAAANLRRHLSSLTAAFPAADECIGRDRETLWCRASAAPWCDVVEFESGALDLHRADFMLGASHEWVLAQRERLRGAAVEGLMRRAESQREDDDYESAIASTRSAVQIDPYNEAAAQLEIELHGERGDHTSLDAAYAALEGRLRDIDVRPSAESAALVERFHRLAREATARIPRPLTSFVDSARLEEVAALVPAHRLLTLVGPGGAGKTRLALEVAHRVASGFSDGAYFADLSTVSEGDALADALSRALGIPTDLASKGFSGIHAMLRNRRALLLLDNCEQIAESCSWFVHGLLEAAAHVHVIATTREAFGLRAERCYALQPLSPENAAHLFADRARSAGWSADGFAATPERIASICNRLDRLPLALELAASMLGTLPLADIERQLDEGLDRLRSRDRTTPARHRSLGDVIAWSVSLLDERERGAFGRLAVFAGSFSAEAAEAVCGVDLAMLATLVAKSVLARAGEVESRFVFLDSIGKYARRLFEAAPQATELRDAHAAWYAEIAMRSDDPASYKNERVSLREIERDFPNVAQALDWSLFDAGFVENGIRLAKGIRRYCSRRGFLGDGISWLGAAIERTATGSVERARLECHLSELEARRSNFEVAYQHARAASATLSESGHDRDLAQALYQESVALFYLGRAAETKDVLDRALPLAKKCGDKRIEAAVLLNFGYLLEAGPNPAASRAVYVEALRLYDEVGDETSVARTLNFLAASDYDAERYDAANDLLERALAIHRDFGNVSQIAGVVGDLGDVAFMGGFPDRARDYYAEALLHIEEREDRLAFPFVLSGIAGLAVEAGRTRDAARLLGAAALQDQAIPSPARVRVREHVRSLVELAFGTETCALEIRAGGELSRKDAMRLARSVLALTSD